MSSHKWTVLGQSGWSKVKVDGLNSNFDRQSGRLIWTKIKTKVQAKSQMIKIGRFAKRDLEMNH